MILPPFAPALPPLITDQSLKAAYGDRLRLKISPIIIYCGQGLHIFFDFIQQYPHQPLVDKFGIYIGYPGVQILA